MSSSISRSGATLEFEAFEYHLDDRFRQATYGFSGSVRNGWMIRRNGVSHLALGPGYQLLRTLQCGVCSTDLARRFLPFPLPQITGHEVVALDAKGRRVAVEINASHHARGVREPCSFCENGLDHHCPDRRVLGIHDLPGGFGPFLLAPVHAIRPIPTGIPDSTAILIEPMAAALHAVATVRPRVGDNVAVLGPRRLGLLIVGALDAYRRSNKTQFRIVAISRHKSLLEMAKEFGADETVRMTGNGDDLPSGMVDTVFDTTGSPEGLELAVRLARREVHLKSTHGRPAAGLKHLTEFVVDELNLRPLPSRPTAKMKSATKIVWLSDAPPPSSLSGRKNFIRTRSARSALGVLARASSPSDVARAEWVSASSEHQIDQAIRPSARQENSLVLPTGSIYFAPSPRKPFSSRLLRAVSDRGLSLTSSRCGDFEATIRLLAKNGKFRDIGNKFVTHRLSANRMNEVFTTARARDCIKAVVIHDLAK